MTHCLQLLCEWLLLVIYRGVVGNYADDNSLCVIREQLIDVKYALEAETEKAIGWFEENHTRANPVKFQCIVHTKAPTLNFSISQRETDTTPSDIVDLLGMIIDDKLSFGQHVKKIIHKAALKLNALRHQSKWLDQDVRLEYGRTFVLSNFQYCPLVWYLCSRSDVLALEQIQKRILRIVLEDYESSYEDLLSKCGMSMLKIQRARTLAIEVYKSIHQMTPIYI